MGQNRTEDSKYESKYGGGFVTPAQFLAESMVARQARHKKQTLPQKFWNIDPWKREFLLQHRLVLSLLKLYEPEAIIRVLRSNMAKRVFSFGAKWLDPHFKTETDRLQKERLRRKETEPVSKVQSSAEPPREAFVDEVSPLNKLRKLD